MIQTHVGVTRRPAPSHRRASGLRVLAFCDYFHPRSGGGAERVAFEIYRRLASWGARVTVVTTAEPGPHPDAASQGLEVVPVRSIDLSRSIGVQIAMTTGAARVARRLAARLDPDVLHANSLQFQTSLAAARLQARSGIPMVLTAHIAGLDALPRALRAAAKLHEHTVGRYVLSRSARVIAVSGAVAEHLDRYPGFAERVLVVPNAVDHERFHPPASTVSRPSEVSVTFIGRLVPNKGPHLLVEALGSLRPLDPAMRVTIIGDGPMRGRLERRVNDLGLAGIVRFVGFSDQVEEHLRTTDVLVRPTLTEGMPLAVLEAMASGVCVVASDLPGTTELIRDGETGLVFPAGDVDMLAQTLRRALLLGRERERLGRAALERSRAYSWDRCARETLDVLLAVAARRRGRGDP